MSSHYISTILTTIDAFSIMAALVYNDPIKNAMSRDLALSKVRFVLQQLCLALLLSILTSD